VPIHASGLPALGLVFLARKYSRTATLPWLQQRPDSGASTIRTSPASQHLRPSWPLRERCGLKPVPIHASGLLALGLVFFARKYSRAATLPSSDGQILVLGRYSQHPCVPLGRCASVADQNPCPSMSWVMEEVRGGVWCSERSKASLQIGK
jgi:hypothetical protein